MATARIARLASDAYSARYIVRCRILEYGALFFLSASGSRQGPPFFKRHGHPAGTSGPMGPARSYQVNLTAWHLSQGAWRRGSFAKDHLVARVWMRRIFTSPVTALTKDLR